MDSKYELIFRDSEEHELQFLNTPNSWLKLQDFEGEGKKDIPMQFTVIAAEKDGFESPFYKLLGFCKLKRDKAGNCSLYHLVSGKVVENVSTAYYQAYDIPENIEADMKQEYELYHKEMYKKWGVSPEVISSTNEAGNAKKVAT